ncbi:MAG: hypothetical protein AAF747_03045 [Planctomycetota bacterium]
MKTSLRLGAVIAPALLAANASADFVVYQDSFEIELDPRFWSDTAQLAANPLGGDMLGRFSREVTRWTLAELPPLPRNLGLSGIGNEQGGADNDNGGGNTPPGNPQVRRWYVEFDFYAIDSWDGTNLFGPDRFEVRANGEMIFSEQFDNVGSSQTFRPDEIGNIDLGYNLLWNDSVYVDLRIEFELPIDATALRIDMLGTDLQGVQDESWAIDNFEVGLVPAPGSAALLVAGAGSLARRRR